MKGILKKSGGPFLAKDLEKATNTLPAEAIQKKSLVIQEMKFHFALIQENIESKKAYHDSKSEAYQLSSDKEFLSDQENRKINGPSAILNNGHQNLNWKIDQIDSNSDKAISKNDKENPILKNDKENLISKNGTENSYSEFPRHSVPKMEFMADSLSQLIDKPNFLNQLLQKLEARQLKDNESATDKQYQSLGKENSLSHDLSAYQRMFRAMGKENKFDAPEKKKTSIQEFEKELLMIKSLINQASDNKNEEKVRAKIWSNGESSEKLKLDLKNSRKRSNDFDDADAVREEQAMQAPPQNWANGDQTKTADSKEAPSVRPAAAADDADTEVLSPTSFARSEETRKLRQYWEQRIDDYERRRKSQLHCSNHYDTKRPPFEVLSASLLSTLDQTSILQSSLASPLGRSNKIKESPFDESQYPHCIAMDASSETVSTNGGWKEKAKWHESNAVVRESIADAHRTREMWQQKAATPRNESPLNRYSISVSNLCHPAGGGSLNRKSRLDHEYGKTSESSGEMSPHAQMRWRAGSGLSAQLERQIKEHRKNAQARNANDYEIQEPFQWPSAIIDPQEQEKILFLSYLRAHPEIIKSLGILVPWNSIPYRLANVQVELAVIGPFETCPQKNDQIGTSNHWRISEHGREAKETPKPQSQTAQTHRTNGHKPATNSPYKSPAKQPSPNPNYEINNNTSGYSTTPKHWKLATWEPPPPPCNKDHSENGDGYIDENGIVYRSATESLIAKEIREYRAREDELRRSRSEFGLPNMDDSLDCNENWKGQNGFDSLRRSKNYGQLQISTESNQNPSEKSSPNKCTSENSRPASAGPKLHSQSPSGEKPLQIIGGGGHKVAAYPPETPEENSMDGVFGPHSEGDFMPVEARIEKEMEDLRKREVELKKQREAMGMKYYPVGLAQFTPRPSLTDCVDNDPAPHGGDNGCTTIREYTDRKHHGQENYELTKKSEAKSKMRKNFEDNSMVQYIAKRISQFHAELDFVQKQQKSQQNVNQRSIAADTGNGNVPFASNANRLGSSVVENPSFSKFEKDDSYSTNSSGRGGRDIRNENSLRRNGFYSVEDIVESM